MNEKPHSSTAPSEAAFQRGRDVDSTQNDYMVLCGGTHTSWCACEPIEDLMHVCRGLGAAGVTYNRRSNISPHRCVIEHPEISLSTFNQCISNTIWSLPLITHPKLINHTKRIATNSSGRAIHSSKSIKTPNQAKNPTANSTYCLSYSQQHNECS